VKQPAPGARAALDGWSVAATVAGNALEFYDFLAYTTFAVYIGRAFFPGGSGANSLLLALATFTQFIIAWLIDVTGDRASPAYYVIATSAISVWAMTRLGARGPAGGR
jgi:hypothetical protein